MFWTTWFLIYYYELSNHTNLLANLVPEFFLSACVLNSECENFLSPEVLSILNYFKLRTFLEKSVQVPPRTLYEFQIYLK